MDVRERERGQRIEDNRAGRLAEDYNGCGSKVEARISSLPRGSLDADHYYKLPPRKAALHLQLQRI